MGPAGKMFLEKFGIDTEHLAKKFGFIIATKTKN